MFQHLPTIVSLTAALSLFTTTAYAQTSLASKCSAGKMKAQGKFAAAVATAEAKFEVSLGTQIDTDRLQESRLKAETKLDDSFAKLETKAEDAGSSCPTTGDSERAKKVIGEVITGFAQSTTGSRFVDNGDGTVTDKQTNLMWGQKTNFDVVQNLANPHDADNLYTWTAALVAPYGPNGTAFTDFLAKLNGSGGTCFAGKCDWRLPTHEELLGIADTSVPACGSGSPCINSIFGAIDTNNFWSSTELDGDPTSALQVDFYSGTGDWINTKTAPRYLFAVRNPS